GPARLRQSKKCRNRQQPISMRASRRTATGEIVPAAILRDGRAKSAASSGWGPRVCARQPNRSQRMTSRLIRNADGLFTGLPEEPMRTTGAIRVLNGRIAAIGDLAPEAGEQIVDASGCVIYPGLVSTHHHLFQSILKGVRAGMNLPLMGWLRSVPHSY